MTVSRLVTRSVLRLALVAGLGALAGCGSLGITKTPDPVCPELRIDRDTAKITVFNDDGTDLTDILFEARIADIKGDCEFEEEGDGPGGMTTARFKVLFSVTRGPAMPTREGHFSYFVALPGFFPAPAAKQVLPVDFTFPEGNMTTIVLRDEEVEVAVPVDSRSAAGDVPLYIGFQLSEQQLRFNRQVRR